MAATAFGIIEEHNESATLHVGNLDSRCNEALLWELMLQAGPLTSVRIPKDKVSGEEMGFGFVEFKTEEDADYALKVMNMIKLFGKPMKLTKSSPERVQGSLNLDVGANLYVGGLDPDVDEKMLHDTFSAFGRVVGQPKVMRDPDTGNPKGFAFLSYDSFEAADNAIANMSGQFLMNRKITVSYALKKDGHGERYGSEADRFLARHDRESAPMAQYQSVVAQQAPNRFFSSGPGAPITGPSNEQMMPPTGIYANAPPPPPPPPAGYGMQGWMPPLPPGGFGAPPSGMPPPPALQGAVPAGQAPAQVYAPWPAGMPPPPPPPGGPVPGPPPGPPPPGHTQM